MILSQILTHTDLADPTDLLEINVPSWQWLCEMVQVFSQHLP